MRKNKKPLLGSSYGDSLSLLGHDINNFLGVIGWGFDLVFLEKENFPFKIKKSVAAARSAVDELAFLVSNFTAIVKMEENDLALAPTSVDVRVLISGAIKRVKPVACREGVGLIEKKGKAIHADVDELFFSRILVSLIENAVKSTPQGKTVNVSAVVQKSDLIIAVSDKGPNVPTKFKEKIFKRSAQREIRSAGVIQGSSFAPVFCKLAAEELGGKIKVESRGKGSGNTFVLSIPRRTGKKS